MGARWPECHVAVRDWLERVVHELGEELGENHVGTYLHRSLASGSRYWAKTPRQILTTPWSGGNHHGARANSHSMIRIRMDSRSTVIWMSPGERLDQQRNCVTATQIVEDIFYVKESMVETYGEHTFDEIVADHSPEVQRLAWLVRGLIVDALPRVVEVPWPHQGTVGYGIGPKKMSEHFCYIAPFRAHVNLGFFYGADLADASGLLEGRGKLLRHVKLRCAEDVSNPTLASLVAEASQYLPKLFG